MNLMMETIQDTRGAAPNFVLEQANGHGWSGISPPGHTSSQSAPDVRHRVAER
jgi:hypothetical protein